MANEEHLNILKQGVEVWNRWREENPCVHPDISNVNLRWRYLKGSSKNFTRADLSSVDLHKTKLERIWFHRADFSKADLSEVNFVRVNLSEANLTEVNLSGAYIYNSYFGKANLCRANLRGSNFRQVDLTSADLSGADLEKAKLTELNLSNARLIGAHLAESDLRGADLRGANLNRADLGGADLREINFSGANLSEVYLRGADLSGSNLNGVDLSGASIGRNVFGNIDLSNVKSLASIRYLAPSIIGVDTIYLSGGKISEEFLRGVGVPDNFITYAASLAGKAIQYYSCFISYSSKDETFAQRVHADLQQKGVRCWFAPEDMKIGDKIRPRIDESIRIHDKLLLILSEHSINSTWVEKEVETAFEEERKRNQTVLFPVRLDEAVIETDHAWAADIRRTRHIGDFSRWKDHDAYQQTFERLLRDLKAEG